MSERELCLAALNFLDANLELMANALDRSAHPDISQGVWVARGSAWWIIDVLRSSDMDEVALVEHLTARSVVVRQAAELASGPH
jgi:hypothetical protein